MEIYRVYRLYRQEANAVVVVLALLMLIGFNAIRVPYDVHPLARAGLNLFSAWIVVSLVARLLAIFDKVSAISLVVVGVNLFAAVLANGLVFFLPVVKPVVPIEALPFLAVWCLLAAGADLFECLMVWDSREDRALMRRKEGSQ